MEQKDIEAYISTQNMISLGTRRNDEYGAKLKIIGWSTNYRKELGVGYNVMVFNSRGEQFGDEEGLKEIDDLLITKDLLFAKGYVNKMSNLNRELLKKVSEHPEEDFTEGFSCLLTYFSIIRWIIEEVYESSSEEDQKYIDEWRNNLEIFSSLETYTDIHPEREDREWTLIGINGNITRLDKIVTCRKKIDENIREVKGSVGYRGVVTGKARVVITEKEREEVEQGEIIVAPMTTLDFLPAMAKASAFVTDEGGITCHAAIVAREMKKPCIIGTRIGTRVIKTGDIIEVDANNGVVRIID